VHGVAYPLEIITKSPKRIFVLLATGNDKITSPASPPSPPAKFFLVVAQVVAVNPILNTSRCFKLINFEPTMSDTFSSDNKTTNLLLTIEYINITYLEIENKIKKN
jgi:hypothetical protein